MCVLFLFVAIAVLFINGVLNIGDTYIHMSVEISHTSHNKVCVLPPHPNNGYWMILNGSGKPGGKVAQNSILIFKCHKGYILSDNPNRYCFEGWNKQEMPECRPLCPPLYSTSTTILNCIDANGLSIDCSKATDGSILKYDCVPYYEPQAGQRKIIYCIEGSWSQPKPQCQPICGKKIDATKLIYGGQVLEKQIYPWVIALYQKDGDVYTNICGGTIISRQAVLTAAHCVTNEYADVYSVEVYRIAAATLHSEYKDDRDKNAKYYKVSRIVVHSQYKGETRRFLGDIALMISKKSFKLGHFIQPVCINDLNALYLQPGRIGEIAGWGSTENNLPSDELRAIEIPHKSEEDCSRELPKDWAEKYNILDKICAGYPEKNISVCKGDSGSGLVFKNIEDNRYYIHGIVSLAPFAVNVTCNIFHSALYTKVSFYYDFIDGELSRLSACRLPEYPENGKWIVEEFPKKSPGDVIALNDIVKIVCYEGYDLISSNSTIDCETLLSKTPICQRSSNTTKCGKTTNDSNGQIVKHSSFPWVVAVYLIEEPSTKKNLRCLGTIISRKLVATVTVCFLYRQRQLLEPKDLIVTTGKFYKDYEDLRNTDVTYHEVIKFLIDKSLNKSNHVDDFGLLLVKYSIEFNNWVQPICVNNLNILELKLGDIAEIAVWNNKNHSSDTETLKTIEVINKNITKCIEEEKLTQSTPLADTMGLCASSSQEPVCPGDLGAGLALKNPADEFYYLLGVYRFSVFRRACPENGFYIKIKYDFVIEQMNKYH